jgi:hypothetical protein
MVSIEYQIEKFIEVFKIQTGLYPDPVEALEQTILKLGAEYILPVEKVVLMGFPLGAMAVSGKYREKVFATRKGKTHVRKLVIPHDPKTGKQIANRSRFAELVRSWKELPESVKAEYNLKARNVPKTGLNIYIQEQTAKK